jgi:hypothetical protein
MQLRNTCTTQVKGRDIHNKISLSKSKTSRTTTKKRSSTNRENYESGERTKTKDKDIHGNLV